MHLAKTRKAVLAITAAAMLLLCGASALASQITFDSSSSFANESGDASLVWTHTTANAENMVLIVGVAGEDSSASDLVVSGVKYAGIDMTPAAGSAGSVFSSTVHMNTELFYLLSPPAGSGNIEVTYSGNVGYKIGGAVTLANVSQTPPEAASANSNLDPNTSISTQIVTHTDGAWIVDIVGCGHPGAFDAIYTPMLERWDLNIGSTVSAACATTEVVSAQTATIGWNHVDYDTNRLAHSLVAFAPGPEPQKASNPNPPNGQIDTGTDVTLSWMPGDGAIAHDVYLGTDFNDVDTASRSLTNGVLVSENQSQSYYSATNLIAGIDYYWRIDEVTDIDIYRGTVWTFRTTNKPPVGDLDGNWKVDGDDLRMFAGQWLSAGCSGQECADFDGINGVNMRDFGMFAANWNRKSGRYGPPVGTFSTDIPVRTDPDQVNRVWESKQFYVIHTDLSPAWLIDNKADRLVFFNQIDLWGLGKPTHFAYAGAGGVEVVQGEGQIDGSQMQEAWVLAWFSGGEGWTDWDVPWLIVLQHIPQTVANNSNGLDFTYAPGTQCGYVAAMPLYGYYKPPVQGKDLLAQAGLQSKNIRTWEWGQTGVPTEVAARCRWWASALRYFPTYCSETFSIDPSVDRITIKEQFTWLQTEDDWGTPATKFAVLPPTLGLAWLYGTFPMSISNDVYDPWYVTPYGPYVGVLNEDSFTIDMEVLQYVNETEVQPDPNTSNPYVMAALAKLQSAMTSRFPGGSFGFDHGENNFVWAAMSDCWYPKALEYMTPTTRANALASMQVYFDQEYLQESRYRIDYGYPHPYYAAFGPGCWDGYNIDTDSGKLATARLYTMWAYAHYADDWNLIRDRWDIVRWSHSTEQTMSWRTVGRVAIAEMGDEAPPSMALARLAYKVGDQMDTYLYACYLFARELVHHYVKMMGAGYYRENMPYHTMDIMPEQIYLTNFWGGTAGWQIDGPTFPLFDSHQWDNRYVRFQSEDVAKFHRDTMGAWLADEINYYLGLEFPYQTATDAPHVEPSQVRLRSFLLNESPAQLCGLADPSTWRGNATGCGLAAISIPVIRMGSPLKYERLIPGTQAYPFVTGLERDIGSTWKGTTIDFYGKSDPRWPLPNWMLWHAPQHPTADDDCFAFGYITPLPGQAPTGATKTTWSWVTTVISYNLP